MVLNQLEGYLKSRKLQVHTVWLHVRNVKRFLTWLDGEGLKFDQLSYGEILKWVGWRQGQGIGSKTLYVGLRSIRYLYESQGIANPVGELHLKGQKHSLLSRGNMLSWEDLVRLYESFDEGGLVGKRYKAILGLLVSQGLKTIDLSRLRLSDIDLERALIRVPETASTSSRVLPILAIQLKDLEAYIYQVRPYWSEGLEDYLILRSNNSYPRKGKKDPRRMGSMMTVLMRQLHRSYGQLLTARQIRQSVITHWLSKHDVRKVQYMAGHRYVSSTQAYGKQSLEDLQERIDEVHPLNGG